MVRKQRRAAVVKKTDTDAGATAPGVPAADIDAAVGARAALAAAAVGRPPLIRSTSAESAVSAVSAASGRSRVR